MHSEDVDISILNTMQFISEQALRMYMCDGYQMTSVINRYRNRAHRVYFLPTRTSLTV